MGGLHGGGMAAIGEWQYLIFLLPFGVGALLLLLSSLRIGGHGHHGGHHGGGAGHRFGGHAGGHRMGHHSPSAVRAAGHSRTHDAASRSASAGATPLTVAMLLFGVGRAPLPMVVEFFLICWGLVGLWAVGNWVHAPHPNLFQMLPSLGLALGGGWAGSRAAAEVVGRIMPRDETSVVSRDALYGLTGKVAFPVSEKSGRVHIYDEFGTLHDEMCCVPDGHALITRGSVVRIVDRDRASGRLLVELASPPASGGQ